MPFAFYTTAIGFVIGVAGQSIYNFSWHLLVFEGMLGCVCLMWGHIRKNSIVLLLGLFLCASVCGSFRTLATIRTLPAEFVSLIDTHITIDGVVVAPPDVRESNDRLTVSVHKGNASTRIIAVASSYTRFQPGDEVTVSGVFTQPKPFDTGGGRIFAYDDFLAKDGVFGIVQPAQVRIRGHTSAPLLVLLRMLSVLHDAFVQAISLELPQPERGLAIGIIAGGKQGLGKELLAAFTAAGMLQIVVLSGYNVMIVAEGLLQVLCAVPKRWRLLLASTGSMLFIFAAGAGTSALRAGVMALFALTARATDRTYDVLRALVLALVALLLWNPLLLVNDPGLQLSFLATLGLILLEPVISIRLLWIHSALIRELVATTLAAQAAVLPLLLYESGNLSIVAPLANVLAMPVIPAAMALSALGALFALCLHPFSPFFSLAAGLPAYVPLAYVIAVAERSARLPFANIILPAFPFWLCALAYGAGGYIVYRIRKMPTPAVSTFSRS